MSNSLSSLRVCLNVLIFVQFRIYYILQQLLIVVLFRTKKKMITTSCSIRLKHYFLLILSEFVFTIPCNSIDNVELNINFLSFCEHNGMKFITFHTLEKNNLASDIFLTNIQHFMQSTTKSIRTRRILSTSIIRNNKIMKYEKDVVAVVANANSLSNFTDHLRLIASRKNRSALLILIDGREEDGAIIEELKRQINFVSANMYFYLAIIRKKRITIDWYKLLSIKGNNKIIAQSIKVNDGVIGSSTKNFDLEGLHIDCLTLSWSPYLILNDCNAKTGKNCQSQGYLAELMNFAGKQLNFTWHCDKEVNDDWGVIQISGLYNRFIGL